MTNKDLQSDCELILGNSNPRFSGVTSTMLQTLPYQQQLMNVRVLGKHHLPDPSLAISFWQLAKLARTPRADGKQRIFHARRNDEMIQALLLKYLFGAKFKMVFTSTAQRHHSRFSRWLMGQMDAVISTCEAAAAYLRTPPARIIYHGIDATHYAPANDRQAEMARLGLVGHRAIGIFGRVREQKGVHLFVQACIECLPTNLDTTAIVVGAVGKDHQDFVAGLQQQVNEAGLGDRILFLGEQPFSSLPSYFRAMSVVAALSRTEGFGLTVLEAMSSGAAVLATDAGAWREVIREGVDGYVLPCEDQQAITEALKSLLANPELTTRMGQHGRARILDRFTIEREAQELCDFFRSLQ